ncbi:DNA-directed RNA polymerase I subunit RPA43 [Discoglossus pictus]
MAEPERPGEKVTKPGKPAEERPGALSCAVLPSFSDACKLVNSRYSCLVVETHRRHLALSPKYLKKKRSGIQEQLNTELLRYSTGLEGVPVAYDNIKLVGELGDIYDDIGHVHVNVEADFVIFRPQYGEKLVGVVNKVAPSHIGCLVHGCFNASIPKPPKMPLEAWQHVEVKVEDQLEFEVFHLDSDAIGVFCIRGNLDKSLETRAIEASKEISALQKKSEDTTKLEDLSDDNVNVTENTSVDAISETIVASQEKPKKKSKKRKHQDTLAQSELGAENVSEVETCGETSVLEDSSLENSSELMPKKERKRKKKKHQDTVLQNSDNADEKETEHFGSFIETDFQEQESETSVLLSQEKAVKKSKKKKHQDTAVLGLELSISNGVAEEVSFAESSLLEELGDESTEGISLKKIKKRHKKKHDSLLQNPDENRNGLEESVFIEPAAESPVNSQEVPKIKGHKKKSQDRLLLASDSSGYLSDSKNKPVKRRHSAAEDDDLSITLAEPKAKKKRKV